MSEHMGIDAFYKRLEEMNKRYQEIAGHPYDPKYHQRGRGNSETKVVRQLQKEFKFSNVTTALYLKLYHLPKFAWEAMRNGVSKKHFEIAVNARKDIRDLVIRKVANKEFKNNQSLRQFINGPKESEPIVKGEPMEEQKSMAEQIRDAFRQEGKVEVIEWAKKFYNDTSDQSIARVKSIVYSATRSIEVELKKVVVWENGTYTLQDEQEKKPTTPSQPEPKESRSKTAVFVMREIRENGSNRYELDVVGDFNRNMIKESLKQLMEVYI